ncbi:MAG: aldehyde dehydrogenase family protein [Solirubrobacteraceae bacterium]
MSPAAAAGGVIHARNPATLELLGTVPVTAPAELAAVIGQAAAVQPLWARLRLEDRARYLRRAAQAVIDEFDEVVELVAAESGRPRVEVAALELLPAIDTLRWLSGYGAELLGERRLGVARALHPLKRARMAHEPVGVVAVIGAGSAPLAHPLCQIAAALIGGNGAVFKPAPRASLAAERLTRLLGRAGLPEGLVRVVHGGAELGHALAGADGVARVLFSGSAPAGGEVARVCAAVGRGVTLEVAGADPMIVQPDANVPRAAAGALWAVCAGAGQAHGTVKRVYVARELHERFLAELVRLAAGLEVGDPLEVGTELGPLANFERRDRLAAAVAEAVAEGAELSCGEPVAPGGLAGAFQSPTVLSGATPAMRVMRERLAGPVVAVMAVEDTTQAIALANDGPSGLGASVWTADRRHGGRIAHELRPGTVWINDHLPSPGVGRPPWSAVTGGNIWRSQGADGLRACVHPKLITWDPPIGRSLWWHPYDGETARAARALAALRSVRDVDRQAALRHGTLALARVAGRSLRSARRR